MSQSSLSHPQWGPTLWLALALLSFLSAPAQSLAQDTPRGELTFAPDRPGVGDSTDVTPLGRGMIEMGAGLKGESLSSITAPGAQLRLGVGSGLELRVGVPSVTRGDGAFEPSGPSVGVKVAGALGESLAWSAVPTLSMGALGTGERGSGSLSLNGTFALKDLSLWVNATPSYALNAGAEVSAGGGVAYVLGDGGAYVNGGFDGSAPFAGAGLWWLLAPAFQVDVGVDAAMDNGLSPLLMIGTSFIL